MTDRRFYRPPYVLAHLADFSGCGHHRIMRPIEIMSRNGVISGRYEAQIWPNEYLLPLSPDVVVWQRQNEPGQIEQMKRYREALPDTFIVYELDDALSLIPDQSFHKPFMHSSIEDAIAEAVSYCDAVSVTTIAMSRYMHRICGNVDIRILPNMLGREDFATAQATRVAARRFHPKPRIGWGGGIGHKGDLSIIEPVIKELGDTVQWVFIGMKPEIDVQVEFHPGVGPRDYLAKLAQLDLDLMVAPLEDNEFNNCKSNLRLIEGGTCFYPVIASDVPTYRDAGAPVFAHCKPDAKQWLDAIHRFLKKPVEDQEASGKKMRQWAERHYNMDERASERLMGWLPKGAKPFKPHQRQTIQPGLTIVCTDPVKGLEQFGHIVSSFQAATTSGNDILYVRRGTMVTAEQIGRLRAKIGQGNIASASPISNDGSFCGFPRRGSFCPMQGGHGPDVDRMCAEMFPDDKPAIPHPVGPAVMLSRRAIDICGMPAFGTKDTEEAGMIEWGVMCGSRGLMHVVAADVYVVAPAPLPPFDITPVLQRTQTRFPPPNVSPDPLAEIRTRLELRFHREIYRTQLPKQSATYLEWVRIFDTPGNRDFSAMIDMVDDLRDRPRFAVYSTGRVEKQPWPFWEDITMAETVSQVFTEASDATWLVYARGDVPMHALFSLAHHINEHPEAKLIYADHDVIVEGKRADFDFKPNFDYELALQRDYLTQFMAVRRDAADIGIEVNLTEADMYSLVLHVAGTYGRDSISHIARILCHIPSRKDEDLKRFAAEKMKRAKRHAEHRGWALDVTPNPRLPIFGRLTYGNESIKRDGPKVSILIPTKDKLDMLEPCLSTLLAMTDYQNYEVLIINNGSTNPAMLTYLEKARGFGKVRVVDWPEAYNWSKINNFGADQTQGDYLLFLNDDTRIIEATWLTQMVAAAQREGVGAVGARLLYPAGLVQHMGVIANKGLTGHLLKGLPDGQPGYQGFGILSREAVAVTGACLLVKRSLFDEAGRFYEDMPHNFNDVAFCLELRRRGYRNVVAASAQLQHIEGATRTPVLTDEGRAHMKREGLLLAQRYPEDEAYWNPNLIFVHFENGMLVNGLNYDVMAWPPKPWPWRGKDWKVERVIVIGDDGVIVPLEAGAGNAVFEAATMGYTLQMVRPPLENTPVWDIRDPVRAKLATDALGIDRIVVRSIVGAPIEILAFLSKLGIPMEYWPRNAEAVCPIGDFKPGGGAPCSDGWLRGQCQRCVLEHGSPFGLVSIKGWRDAWARFLSQATINTQNGKANGYSLDETIQHVMKEASHGVVGDSEQRTAAAL